MDIQKFAKFAITLLENRTAVEYYNFLEKLKTSDTQVLIESAQKGFTVMFEGATDDSMATITKYARGLEALIAKFKGGDNGLTATQQMCQIIEKKQGTVKVDAFKSWPDLIKNYEFSPEGASTEEDVKNAKNILITSCFPTIMKEASSGVGNIAEGTKKQVVYDTIITAFQKIKTGIDGGDFKFDHENPRPVLSWAIGHMKSAKGEERAFDSKQAVRNAWKAGTPKKKGEVVSNERQTWKALVDLSAEDNRTPPNEYDEVKTVGPDGQPAMTEKWEKYMPSSSDYTSTSAPVGDKGKKESDTVTVGDTLEDKSEDKPQNELMEQMRKMADEIVDEFDDPINKGLALTWVNNPQANIDYPSLFDNWKKLGLEVAPDETGLAGSIKTPEGKVLNFNRANISNWRKKVNEIVIEKASHFAKKLNLPVPTVEMLAGKKKAEVAPVQA